MSQADDARKRLWIRVALVAGILVSAGGLVWVWLARPTPPEAPPPLARGTGTIRLRVVDEQGKPVPGALVFVLPSQSAAPGEERWLPDQGLLEMTAGPHPRSVLAIAPGRRLQRVDGVMQDRDVVLEPGLQVRIRLRNRPDALPAPHIRFLLRIRPDEALLRRTPGLDATMIVDLMDNLGGPDSGPRGMPRGEFGYAVSGAQAEAGLLVPEAGRYHVHWGLMDLRAGTWFSLGDVCGRGLEVRDRGEPTEAELDVTEGHLQQTLVGLQTSVKRLDQE